MTPPSPERNRTVRIVDLVVGIVLALLAGLIGVVMLAYVTQLGQLSAVCEGIAPDGARCSPDFLGGMGIAGTAIVVLGWFLPTGFLIVRAIQKRRVFFLPIISIAAMIAGYFVVTAVLGSAYLPAA